MNRKLYVDSLKQLRIVGIIGTVILTVVSLFLGYGNTLLTYSYSGEIAKEVDIADFGAYFYLLIFAIGLFAPIMAMVQFSFLHKRNASDFFHALPVKRGTMFWTMLAAVGTWTAIMVALPTSVLLFFYGACQYVTFEAGRVLYTLLVLLVIWVLIIGAITVAIGSTGTTFSNLAVAFIVLFVPRIVMLAITYAISSSVETLSFDGVEGFFGVRTNALFCMGYQMIDGVLGSGEYQLPTAFSLIYTGGVGLIYLAIGYISFTKRHSEVASMPSFSKVWQTILRIIPAMCISMIGTILLAGCFLGEMSANDEVFFYILLTYSFAVVAYFLYELITTRSWKEVGRSARFLPLLIAVNVIIFCAVLIPSRVERSVRWNADKVDAVVISDDSYTISFKELGKIDDREVVKIAVEAFNSTMDEFYTANSNYAQGEYTTLEIIYYTDWGPKERRVRFSDELYREMVEALKNLKTQTITHPKFNVNTTSINTFFSGPSIVAFEDKDLVLNAYDIWREEVDNVASFVSLLSDHQAIVRYTLYDYFHNQEYTMVVNSETPKTLKYLVDTGKLYQNTTNSLDELMADRDNIDWLDFDIQYYEDHSWTGETISTSSSETEDVFDLAVNFFKDYQMTYAAREYESSQIPVVVSITWTTGQTDDDEYGYYEETNVVNLTKEELDAMLSLTGQ